jgi:membrane protein YdbS with pleckstrin-like domain
VVTTDAFWVLVSGAFWVLVVLTVFRVVGLWLRRRWREESARQDLIVSVVLGDTETTP